MASHSNYANLSSGRPIKFHEGWLEHRQNDRWTRCWCALWNTTICIYRDQRATREGPPAGTIEVGPGSRLETREGDDIAGFRFDLHTKTRVNRFKASKFSERELWKAYLIGIISEMVPDTLDLLPGQIEDVRAMIQQLPPRLSHNHQRRLSDPHLPVNHKEGYDSPNNSTSGSFLVDQENYLEPVTPRPKSIMKKQKYTFYSSPSQHGTPSWFFPSCSRDLAEKILNKCTTYGNTLMRESANDHQTLVISKRYESSSGVKYNHFKLLCQPYGYKLDVENLHEPMTSLSEIMDFFVATSGVSTTHLMTCNDFKTLGIEGNDYSTRIMSFTTDADSGEETFDGDQERRKWTPTVRDVHRSQTTREPPGHNLPQASEVFSQNIPVPPAPPPPCPHVQKSILKKSSGIPARNLRSKSVPNINPEELASALAARKATVEAQGSPTSHIMRTSQGLNTSSQERNSMDVRPPLPPNHPQPYMPSPSQPSPSSTTTTQPSWPDAPALPPNHPPPLKKASSQPSGLIAQQQPAAHGATVGGARKMMHSKSMGAADGRNQRLKLKAAEEEDELAKVSARILKNKEIPPVEEKAEEHAAVHIEPDLHAPAAVPVPSSATVSLCDCISEHETSDDDSTIVYAHIRRKTPPSRSNLNGSLGNYQNWHVANISQTYARHYDNRTLQGPDQPADMIYIEMKKDCKLEAESAQDEMYEPIEDSSKNKEEKETGESEKVIFYTNDDMLPDTAGDSLNVSSELYEPIENMVEPNYQIGRKEGVPARRRVSIASVEQDNDIFQTISFTNRSKSLDEGKNFSFQAKTYEAIEKGQQHKYGQSSWIQRRIGSLPREFCFSTHDSEKAIADEDVEENEVYEMIQFKTKQNTSANTYIPFSISTPDEIYEGIEWKPQNLRENNSQSQTNKFQCDIKKMSALALPVQRISTYSSQFAYSEVPQNLAKSLPANSLAYYVDIIANYEDIKVAKAARGSFSGPSTEKPSNDGAYMRRSKSEICRSSLSEAATQDFKRKLENTIGNFIPGQAPMSPTSPTAPPAVPPRSHGNDDVYESIDHYQNSGEIIQNFRNGLRQ